MKHSIFLTLAVLLSACQQPQVPAPPLQTAAPAKPVPAAPHRPVKDALRPKGTLVFCTLAGSAGTGDPFDTSEKSPPDEDGDHWKEKSSRPFDAEKFRAAITERERTSIEQDWIASGLQDAAVCLDAQGIPVAMIVRMNEPGSYEIIRRPLRSKDGGFFTTAELDIVHVKDNGSLAAYWK